MNNQLLFNVYNRISAAKISRDPNGATYPRPTSTWTHLAMGLCFDSSTTLPTQSFLSNFASVPSADHPFCTLHQAADNDYKGNTQELKIDRGHIVPNGIMNQNEDAAKTTFTLTNIAPQHSNFNQQAWNQLECMVRQYMEREIPNDDAYVLTGTYGTKLTMNADNDAKNNVRLPEYYWKAFCYYDQSGTAYSWVYIQINENDQTRSSGDLFMTTRDFSNQYYQGESLFNNQCQTAGMGPWEVIADAWSTYRNRWGC